MKNWIFKMVAQAIKMTKEEYYKYDNTVMYERIFCYEFYHQFRKIQDKEFGSSLCYSFILSGEPHKHMGIKLRETKELTALYTESKGSKCDHCYPDFILHGGLKDKENQILAIEVKIKPNKNNLSRDIKKLQILVDDEKLQFQYGLFIAIGMTNEELKSVIKKVDRDILTNPNNKKIYFIGVESVLGLENSENQVDEFFRYED